jgi:hypothetical protein
MSKSRLRKAKREGITGSGRSLSRPSSLPPGLVVRDKALRRYERWPACKAP